MKPLIIITLLAISFSATSQVKLPSLSKPPAQMTIFGEGSVSTSINERDFALSPDGKEIFYTMSTPKSSYQTIVFMKRQSNGSWSPPEIASFAGMYTDLEPAFSADGNTIYFASNRPLNGLVPKDFDIWKVNRTNTGWGVPQNLGTSVNTATDEFYPSITKSGNLYWTASYKDKGALGREDIFVSSIRDGVYQTAVALDSAVNSNMFEFNAFVDPNEQYILFSSYGRKGEKGGSDLYISVKNAGGKWQPAKLLSDLNSDQLDYCPFVSPDGTTLFFTSERHDLPADFLTGRASVKKLREIWETTLNGTGNIYWVDFQQILKGF